MLSPRFRQMTPETVPGAPSWTERLFLLLNQSLQELVGAVAELQTSRRSRVVKFRTEPNVDDTFTDTRRPVFKNELPVRPTRTWIGKVERVDGAPIRTAVSLTWTIDGNGNVALTYVAGLEPSTEYVLVIVYE